MVGRSLCKLLPNRSWWGTRTHQGFSPPDYKLRFHCLGSQSVCWFVAVEAYKEREQNFSPDENKNLLHTDEMLCEVEGREPFNENHENFLLPPEIRTIVWNVVRQHHGNSFSPAKKWQLYFTQSSLKTSNVPQFETNSSNLKSSFLTLLLSASNTVNLSFKA